MSSGASQQRKTKSLSLDLEGILGINWEGVTCPICLDFPHNGVLLYCSSFGKGCRPFMCDTGRTHSNCLDRFKTAYEISAIAKGPSDGRESIHVISSSTSGYPTCPLCRGDVRGWVVFDEARAQLNTMKRCCEEKYCPYVGNFAELQNHAKLKHPYSRPSEIDPARRLDWENLQQTSEVIDVLSTIQAEVPNGVVMGDYVIEYGDEAAGDEFAVPRDRGHWWKSCIFYKVFFRVSRSRGRSRARESRRGTQRQSVDHEEVSGSGSADSAEYRFEETDDRFVRAAAGGGGGGGAFMWNP